MVCEPATTGVDAATGAATVDGDSGGATEAGAVSGGTAVVGATGGFVGDACVAGSGDAGSTAGEVGGVGFPVLTVSPLVARRAAASEYFAVWRGLVATGDAATCAPLDACDAAFAAYMAVAAGALDVRAGR